MKVPTENTANTYKTLKFRQIGWHQIDCSFAETIAMRPKHMSNLANLSEEDYVTQNRREEADLVSRFGACLTETV